MLTDMSAMDAVACSKSAEKGNIESIWVPEMTRRDSITILSSIAISTQRIKIAPGILNIYSRTPALACMTLASLQELSGGRVLCGLSTGNLSYIPNIHGLKIDRNIERLREFVLLLKSFFPKGSLDYHGKIFDITNWSPGFKSLQELPIYIGAHGKRMLKLAGEVADGVILNLMTVDELRRATETVRNSAREHMRDPAKIDISSIIMVSIDEDKQLAEKRVRKQIAFYLARSERIRKRLLNSEFGAEIERMEGLIRKETLDSLSGMLSNEIVDALSIYGGPRDLEVKLEQYRGAGLSLPLFYVAGWMGDSISFVNKFLSSADFNWK